MLGQVRPGGEVLGDLNGPALLRPLEGSRDAEETRQGRVAGPKLDRRSKLTPLEKAGRRGFPFVRQPAPLRGWTGPTLVPSTKEVVLAKRTISLLHELGLVRDAIHGVHALMQEHYSTVNPDEQRASIGKVIDLMKARQERQAMATPAESSEGTESGAPGGAPGSASGAPHEKTG